MPHPPTIGHMHPIALLVTIFVVATLTPLFWKGVYYGLSAILWAIVGK